VQGCQFLVAYSHSNPSLEAEMRAWFCLFRHRKGIEACTQSDGWWFRVDRSECEDSLQILAAISQAEIFHLDEAQHLVPLGKTVPVGKLPPNLPWQSLSGLSRLWLPASHSLQTLDGTIESVTMQWERSSMYREPSALLCHFDDWRHFVMRNVKQRWGHLQFACRDRDPLVGAESHTLDGVLDFDTLVVGSPIPSLPGLRLRQESRILLPVEFQWTPAVSAAALVQAWGINDQGWILWTCEDCVDFLTNDDFCWATRASVHATGKDLVTE
jgi:hypothetical protein